MIVRHIPVFLLLNLEEASAPCFWEKLSLKLLNLGSKKARVSLIFWENCMN
jgi:hypothetical protein